MADELQEAYCQKELRIGNKECPGYKLWAPNDLVSVREEEEK